MRSHSHFEIVTLTSLNAEHLRDRESAVLPTLQTDLGGAAKMQKPAFKRAPRIVKLVAIIQRLS